MADPKYVKDFIDQMTPYAVAVGDQYGIDPITIITQAAVETGWGREVAGNNYFGVKSHGKPGGQNITTHEEINGKRVKVQDNFRSYGSLGESVADYGRFLSENPRYAEALKETGRSELKGIANAGYATSSDYRDLTNNVAGMVERNIRPLPPGSLPEVASLLDVVPPRAVAPVTSSPDLAQMRRTNIPSQLMPDTFASLPTPRANMPRAADLGLTEKTAATPYLKRNGDVLDPAGVVLGKEMVTSLPGTRKAVPQSNIERTELPRFSPDYISTSRQRVASTNPTLLPPIPPSTLGQGPSTRAVQSVPVGVAPVPAGVDERLAARTNPNLPQNQPQRVAASTPFVPEARYIEPLNAKPPAVQTGLAGRVALPPGVRPQIPSTAPAAKAAFVPEPRYIEPRNVAAIPDRLPSTPMAGRFAAPPTVVYDPSFSTADVTGTVGQTIRPTGPLAPLPRTTIARAPLPADPYRAVGTALDTTMPAMPRPRPNLGMGGVDIPGTISQTGQVAPMPAPRLQRPGIFGRPQLFGHDIPLPGIFGALQNATMAMNNASGPFNNGADNSLYNRLRGGDFNTPGAATQQAGGFLYAAKPGGGFVNVGRVNPAQSGAALYDARTTRNDSRDDAANRVNGSSSRGSGGARSLLD